MNVQVFMAICRQNQMNVQSRDGNSSDSALALEAAKRRTGGSSHKINERPRKNSCEAKRALRGRPLRLPEAAIGRLSWQLASLLHTESFSFPAPVLQPRDEHIAGSP
ncbi:hypothetical protein R1flu_018874 [Riccia fluitans]|uniref:Uncharacterized protein n=1 Tax=Riccia fluitans TaxID=41844 RepID=A0ABD1ZH32_9MARC